MKSSNRSGNRSGNRSRNVRLRYHVLEPRQMLSANLPALDLTIESSINHVSENSGSLQSVLEQIASNDETAYLVKNGNALTFIADNADAAGTTFLFQQSKHRIPIEDAFLTIVLDGEGQYQELNGSGYEDFDTSGLVQSAIGSASAEEIANQDVHAGPFATTSALVWTTTGQLGWQVDTFLETSDLNHASADYSTIVDAQTGVILSQGQPTSVAQLLHNPDTKIGIFPRIVINDTIGPTGSRDYAASFDSVVALALGCTGTLIASNVVLSARHCEAAANDQIIFGEDSANGIYTATVETAIVPAGDGTLLDGGDVSILILTEDVPEDIATPMRMIDLTDDLEGFVAATIGYGLNGVGSEGHGNTSDGWRWGGENIIDAYGEPSSQTGANIFSTDFDDGTDDSNTIPSGDLNPLEFEATTAPGDSGGPLLVQFGDEWVIAAVLSGGTSSTSVYGDISWWTGIQPFRAEIEMAGGVFAEGSVAFDQDSYFVGDTITVTVEDEFVAGLVEVTITSDSGDSETLVLTAAGTTFTGTIAVTGANVSLNDGSLQVSDEDSIVVSYGFSASDQAVIESTTVEGTAGDDVITVVIDELVTITVNGVPTFIDSTIQNSLKFDALGGNDKISIVDSSGNDRVVVRNQMVQIDGVFSFYASSVESVELISGGGSDQVRLFGSSNDELFESYGNLSKLTGDGFAYSARDYDRTLAFALGGNDQARLHDSPGNDQFYATPVFANLTTASRFVNVRDFDHVSSYSRNGGYDTATLVGTDGDDNFYANPKFALMTTDESKIVASGFDRVSAKGGAGQDTAFLVGSDDDDRFVSKPYDSYLYSDGYFNRVLSFETVRAEAGEGNDRAIMHDSPGEDVLYATPTYSVLYSDQFRSQANGFDRISAFATSGFDKAIFVDTAGDEQYIARSTDAFMIGDGFLNYAAGFNRVSATSTGGDDVAILHGSIYGDRFFGSQAQSYVTGSTGGNFFNWAGNFKRVRVKLSDNGFNIGRFSDSDGDDRFVGSGVNASLFGDDYSIVTSGLNRAVADSSQGGSDTLTSSLLEFELIELGNWNE